MTKKICYLISFLLLSLFAGHAQFDNIAFENKTYVEGIKSIKLSVDGFALGYPVIKLNSGDRLCLVFDDLLEDNRYLKYTVIHCTHDWHPSDLNQLEYIDGFAEDEITDYSYSFNTIQHYIKYKLVFPNDILKITKSGNYILYVYDDNQQTPILTRRFMVEEDNPAEIAGSVHSATDVSYRYSKQEIDFTVLSGNYIVRNPAMYLHATIMQNGRWDNAITGLTYRSGKPGEYSFDYDNNSNVFNGGAEFDYFSIKSLRYNGDRIVSVGYQKNTNQAWIMEDVARPFGAYETNTTLKGSCFWENEDFSGTNTEDYVLTHFSLKCNFPVQEGKLYVFGELTDWKIDKDAVLTYNEDTGYYEASLYIKQGYYNYQYIYVKDGTTIADETFIEGNHWETQNDYAVMVFLQEEGSHYDKLIGVVYLTLQK